VVTDAYEDIWNDRFQFGPCNTGVVETNLFRSTKAMTYLSVHSNSTCLVNAYSGTAIFEKITIK